MKIKFLKDAELQVYNSWNNEEDCGDYDMEIFFKNSVYDVDKFGETEKTMDIQFGDGSVIIGLDKTLIEVLE